MRSHSKILAVLFLAAPIGLLGLSLWLLFFWVGPFGSWQGVLDSGMTSFRVALVLQRDPDGAPLAMFNNIDDGIYNQPFKNTRFHGNSFWGELPTGEIIDLSLGSFGFGSRLSGTYTESRGSFQKPGKVVPLILSRGDHFLIPRMGPDSQPVTNYVYQVPLKETDGWEVGRIPTPESSLNKLLFGVSGILSGGVPRIHSLLVVKGGRLVLDEYFYGYGPEDLHPIQSITKSVFSLLFGIAEDQGLLNRDQKLFEIFPDKSGGKDGETRRAKITLESLLTMRSGFQCDDWSDSQACSWEMVNSPDWLSFTLSLPVDEAPGKRFAYCGACLTPLSAALALRGGRSVPEFAAQNMFNPLRIKRFEWMEGPGGVTPASFGLSLRPRDLAKLGQLILNQGRWNGQSIVSPEWVRRSTSAVVQRGKGEPDYGYLWWVRTFTRDGKEIRVLDGWGVGGQHLFIVPDLDMVCVITAGNYKSGRLGANSLKFFQEYILGL